MAELAASLVATEADRLNQAEALVRNYCGWHIAPERTETVTVRGNQGRTLALPSLYVTDLAFVMDGTTALYEDDDYTWSTAGIVTRIGWWSTDLVEFEMTHGYAEVPPEVTAVVQAVAQRAINNPGSLVRQQDGPFSDTYSQTGFNQSLPVALLDAEKDVLRRYRIPAVG